MPDLWIVDSFTNRAFRGNPAGVHLVTEFLEASRMQQIASELNLSETAFVCGDPNLEPRESPPDAYRIRYFSPKQEIPLCGHATLASAKVLFERTGLRQLTFQTGSEIQLDVCRRGDQIEMQFPIYDLVDAQAPESLLTALGVTEVLEVGFNVETKILMIEIESSETLRALSPDFSALLQSCDSINGLPLHGVSVTARAQDEYDFHSRFFWPWSGGSEDPVTGGTHTFLAKYWAHKLDKRAMRSFQASARTGHMEVELKSSDTLLIRGQAVVILDARLRPLARH
ncbi:MAG: PhzF family phenazine biosynthesis isomerase [Planctomycetota bacterium]